MIYCSQRKGTTPNTKTKGEKTMIITTRPLDKTRRLAETGSLVKTRRLAETGPLVETRPLIKIYL